MEQKQQEEAEIKKRKDEIRKKEEEVKQKLKSDAGDKDKLSEELKKLQLEKSKVFEEEAEFEKQLKNMPWNVDTIGKESWSKTVINKPQPREDRSNLSEDDLAQRYKDFVDKNEKYIKEYAMLSRFDACKSYLMEHQDLGMSNVYHLQHLLTF